MSRIKTILTTSLLLLATTTGCDVIPGIDGPADLHWNGWHGDPPPPVPPGDLKANLEEVPPHPKPINHLNDG